ncbi:MAG: DNA primase DnaG [Thermoplasmata archaeon]|nr:DNA primase DnaG [Thermoplasmata archaeon]
MEIDPSTTKYLIHARISADGIVEKPDVVGAIFGQTEGLLGDELDLRDLQKSGRIGRIEVEVNSNRGKSEGRVFIPSSLDQVETAILGSALETIDRVGPCKARISVDKIEDVRISKRNKIVDRAKQLLNDMIRDSRVSGGDLTDSVRQSVQVEEIVNFGRERLPAGPNIENSDAIIVVEGRSDVLNLLKHGIKNAIAVEGTSVPRSIAELAKDKVVTAFVDGDRGGELILRELLQVAEVDFIARAPKGQEVEELAQKQIMKCLRNKMPAEQFVDMFNIQIPQRAMEDDEAKALATRQVESIPPARPEMPESRGRSENSRHDDRRSYDSGKKLSVDQEKLRGMLIELSASSKARLLAEDLNLIAEIPVKELANKLKDAQEKISAVVFDGVVTQRILDLATDKKIPRIVGAKLGNITKHPTDVEIWTREDLT